MKQLIPFIFLLVLVAIPTSADAYKTTAQKAWKITENSALFAIEYRFGGTQGDFYMPGSAVRNQPYGSNLTTLGFELLEDDVTATTTGVVATGIVSQAKRTKDGMFVIPKNTTERFILLAILNIPEDALEANYALKVSDLPFYVGEDRDRQGLLPTELQYYITPDVELNSDQPSKN